MDQKKPALQEALHAIKDRIAGGDLQGAIGLLKSLGIHKEVYNLEARYNRLQSSNVKGTLSQSEYHLELNRISDALLELANRKVPPQKTSKTILFASLGILSVAALAYFMLQLFQPEAQLRLAEKDGKYGYVDEEGTILIPFEYDSAQEFEDATARVEKEGLWCTINKKGQCVLDCDNIAKYENARTRERNLEQILQQARDVKGQLQKNYEIHKEQIGKDILIGNAEKEDLLSLVNRNQLLRVRKKPFKESLFVFQFIPVEDSPGSWYKIKTYSNFYWHTFKRPSTFTDSGIETLL